MALVGTRIEDITPDQHARAWAMWKTAIDPKLIRKNVRLTGPQWHWLVHEGKPKTMPAFMDLWLEEIQAIRSEALECGREISTRGLPVIRRVMMNAEQATLIANALLHKFAEDVQRAITDGTTPKPPAPEMMEALRLLRAYADLRPVAFAYRAIYCEPPAARLAHPGSDSPRATLDLTALGAPGPMATLDEDQQDAAMVPDSLLSEIGRWTTAQREHFARTGEEPDPSDVIDVQST